jgi:transposase-like protein
MEKKTTKSREKRSRMEDLIPDEQLRTEILSKLYSGEPLFGDQGIFTGLLQSFVNAALEGEMGDFIRESKSEGKENRRNGHTPKLVRSTSGPLEIKTPRDRNGDYEPLIIKKRERELSTGMDNVILSLYARGQSIEDVKHQIRQIYGIEISDGSISAVTDKVWDEISLWRQRPLEPCYVIVYLDAIHYKVREEGKIVSKAIYTIYAVTVEGKRDILGLYLDESESSRQWGLILEDIKKRGVEDVLFFSIDGLSGFKDVIEQVYPDSSVQRCLVHKIRNSTKYVRGRERTAVCADLRKIYTSANRSEARLALEDFGVKWGSKYKEIKPSWEKDWDELMLFLDFNKDIRRMIYTTNPVEAVHRVMRKITKTKGAWSNERGLIKQLYLTLKYNEKSWKKEASRWMPIQRDLMDYFGERYIRHLS